MLICFFRQKTAYEVRISDWSSDVCLPISTWHDFSVPPGRALKRLDEASALCMGDWPARSGDGPADMLVATRWERICRGWVHRCRYQRCGAGFRDAEVGFADQDRKSTRLNSSH